MQVILVQVRSDRPAEQQERLCFLEATKLRDDELISMNLVDQPTLDWSQISGADAVIVGGAGGHTVTQAYDFSSSLAQLIVKIVDNDMPFFGSCFGHHALVQALGGEVETDHASGEVGTFDVELTKKAHNDALLQGFPQRFAVQLGHHDRVVRLPAGMVELASSERCRHQMLKVENRLVYSTQFHSELNRDHLAVRLEMYRDSYLSERTSAEEISRALRPSPWPERLLEGFLRLMI